MTEIKILEFYTEQSERQRRRNSDHGEVPAVFKTNSFQISISGQTLALPNPWSPTRLHAELSVKEANSETFVHQLTTEAITGESSPKFVRRANFSPLDLDDSQSEATRTILKVDVFLNKQQIFTAQCSLAKLLWDCRFEHVVEPVFPSLAIVKNKRVARGKIFLDAISGRPPHLPKDEYQVILTFELSSKAWTSIAEQKSYLAICSVGFHGRWNRLYASDHVKKPFMRSISTTFPRIYLRRSDLTNGNKTNPIRVELYGCRKGYPRLLGFFHFMLADLENPKEVVWNAGQSSGLQAQVATSSASVSPVRSEAHFLIDAVRTSVTSGRGSLYKSRSETKSPLSPTAVTDTDAYFESTSRATHERGEGNTKMRRNFTVSFPEHYITLLEEDKDEDRDGTFTCPRR